MKWILPSVAALGLALDIVSKSWALASLNAGQARPLVPGILRLNLTTNTGAAFGLGHGNGWFMTILAVTILSAVVVWLVRRERSCNPLSLCERIGAGLLVGGAAGNIWERLLLGRVTDFLEFSFIDFPVFNAADVLIDLGALLIPFAGSPAADDAHDGKTADRASG